MGHLYHGYVSHNQRVNSRETIAGDHGDCWQNVTNGCGGDEPCKTQSFRHFCSPLTTSKEAKETWIRKRYIHYSMSRLNMTSYRMFHDNLLNIKSPEKSENPKIPWFINIFPIFRWLDSRPHKNRLIQTSDCWRLSTKNPHMASLRSNHHWWLPVSILDNG